MSISNYDARLQPLIDRLVARGHRGLDLGLARVRTALSRLGHPERHLPVIHIAGTNGKGSTAAMVESIARAAGLRTGLFTSPHLVHFNERIQLAGLPIDDAAFASALERALGGELGELTFFETLTLAAFVAFREAELDVVVLEVGLGGRLDATNVIETPLATGITTITEGLDGRYLEHQNLLGDSISAIAREKVGIAKSRVPLVLGRLGPEAHQSIIAVARAVGADPIWRLEDLAQIVAEEPPLAHEESTPAEKRMRSSGESVWLPDGSQHLLRSALAGAHQRDNAAVAIALSRLALGAQVDALAVRRGLDEVRWPGRLERILHHGVEVWLDGAHNLEGARALAQALPGVLGGAPATLLFGALADKPFTQVLELLAPFFAQRIYTEPKARAPAPAQLLAQIAPGVAEPVLGRAIETALSCTGRGGRLVVTGSLYLVGSFRAFLRGSSADPALGL